MFLEGNVIFKGETKSYGEKGFRKRELVVETSEEYPQKILTEFVQDKCDILDGISVGQKVKVSINLRGRSWVNPQGETKYFNTIQGWRVEVLGVSQSASSSTPPVAPKDAFEPQQDFNEEDHDDLPF